MQAKQKRGQKGNKHRNIWPGIPYAGIGFQANPTNRLLFPFFRIS